MLTFGDILENSVGQIKLFFISPVFSLLFNELK